MTTRTGLSVDAPEGSSTLRYEREFEAPKEAVWRAHTDPTILARWVGPRRLTMIVKEYDVRDGGKWAFTHRDPDGTDFEFRGVFHSVTPDRIIQTFEFLGAPGQVDLESIEFEDLGGRTRLVGVATYLTPEARDSALQMGMEGGMTEGYERLDELLDEAAAGTTPS